MNKEQLNQKLFEAVEDNNIKEVKTLIEKGADVNTKDNLWRTTLMLAANFNCLDIMKLLIENEADINAKDNVGRTVLMYAKNTKHLNIIN